MTQYDRITNLTTQLIGQALGADDFDRLKLHVQRKIENKREWMLLKGHDTSLTFSAADYNNGALSAKTLPAAVIASLEFLADRPVVLVDPAGNEYPVDQIPIEAKQSYYNIVGKYFIDYFNNTITFTGQASQTYTVLLNFKQVTPEITSSQTWLFPAKFENLIAFGISIIHKMGIDYDFINAMQAAQGQGVEYADMWGDMVLWDSKMQVDSLKGLDRFANTAQDQIFISGRINTN